MKQLENLAVEYEALTSDRSRREWAQFTTGLDFDVEGSQRKVREFLKDKSKYKIVRDHMAMDLAAVDRRKAEIFNNEFKLYHLSDKANQIRDKIDTLQNKLNDILNKHRSELNGRQTDTTVINKILNEDPDRELRKKAFLARAQVNRPMVEGGFVELLKLRRELAAACGAENFVSFQLERDELDPKLFSSWKAECRKHKARVKAEQNEWAAKIIGAERMEPWDAGFIKSQVCSYNKAKVDIGNFFEPIEKTFAAYGFEIGKLNLTYDVFPRKNKSEWGYMFTIQPGRDSRVLANVNDRFSSFNVLLHETAHGVHFLGLDPEERILSSAVSGIVAEGFANFFGDRSYSREFLEQIFKDKTEAAHSEFQNMKAVEKLGRLSAMSLTLFDQDLYFNEISSIEDIHALLWKTNEDLLGKTPYAEEPAWAYLIHHTVAPVYLHNYFLGDVMCDTMKRVFKRHLGKEAESEPVQFGEFWREKVLKPSGRYPFAELYEKVCEEPVSISAYLE